MPNVLAKKNKTRCLKFKEQEKFYFILRSIFRNSNLFLLTRWNAFFYFDRINKMSSKTSISYRCVYTFNKKRFNKLIPFSRHFFLKLARSGQLTGFKKFS